MTRCFFLAWTTTPWTLPSNLGLTVGANIDYVLVKTFNPYTHLPINVVLAEKLVSKYFKPEGENSDLEGYQGRRLRSFHGKSLRHLKGHIWKNAVMNNCFHLKRTRQQNPVAILSGFCWVIL